MNRFYIGLGLTILGSVTLLVAVVSGILVQGKIIHGEAFFAVIGIFGGCITLVTGASILHEVHLEEIAEVFGKELQKRGLGK